jgi:hypothetical protein
MLPLRAGSCYAYVRHVSSSWILCDCDLRQYTLLFVDLKSSGDHRVAKTPHKCADLAIGSSRFENCPIGEVKLLDHDDWQLPAPISARRRTFQRKRKVSAQAGSADQSRSLQHADSQQVLASAAGMNLMAELMDFSPKAMLQSMHQRYQYVYMTCIKTIHHRLAPIQLDQMGPAWIHGAAQYMYVQSNTHELVFWA